MPRRLAFCTVTYCTVRLSIAVLSRLSVMMPARKLRDAPPSRVRCVMVTPSCWTSRPLETVPPNVLSVWLSAKAGVMVTPDCDSPSMVMSLSMAILDSA